MAPVYGLAECSVGLAFLPLGRKPVIDRVNRDQLSIHGIADSFVMNAPVWLLTLIGGVLVLGAGLIITGRAVPCGRRCRVGADKTALIALEPPEGPPLIFACLCLNSVDLVDLEVDQGGIARPPILFAWVRSGNMTKASTGTTARSTDDGDRMSAMPALTKGLQRFLREFDRVSWRIPFRPTHWILYPDPNQRRSADLKD